MQSAAFQWFKRQQQQAREAQVLLAAVGVQADRHIRVAVFGVGRVGFAKPVPP